MDKGLPGHIHYYLINPCHPLKGRKKLSRSCHSAAWESVLPSVWVPLRYLSALGVQARTQPFRWELCRFKTHLDTSDFRASLEYLVKPYLKIKRVLEIEHSGKVLA